MKRSSIALAGLLAALALAVSQAAGAPEQTPKRGGTVVFGPVAESVCLNPIRLQPCGVGPQMTWIWDKVLLPAFAMAPDFTKRPALVSGVTLAKGPPFAVTFHIRPEARWSDGVQIGSRDFAFTHRTRLALLAKAPPDVFDVHKLVKSIEIVNSKTFRVVFRERAADYRDLFYAVLPRHVLTGRNLEQIWTDGIDDPRTGRPIGSGPFLVERWERGKQLTLVRNPRYWGPHTAHLNRLVVRYCRTSCQAPTPAEVIESFRTGAVDMVYERTAENVPSLRRIRGTRVVLYRTNGWEHLTLRQDPGGHPALGDKRVRQALAYGIDRAAIVKQLWGVIDSRYSVLQSAVLLNSARGYSPNWEAYSYRPNLARRLLGRAGCRPGSDGIYICGQARLSLRLFTSLGTPQRVQAVELMQAQLRRVGIDVRLSFTTFPALLDVVDGGDFDAAAYAWIFVNGYRQKGIFGCGGPQNVTGYCQRLVTSDVDQADRILDDVQRARVLNRVDRQLAKDIPLIPLYQIPYVVAYDDTVRNVVPSPDNLFWNAEDWWLDD